MKFSKIRIVFEIFYLLTIVVVGLFCGLFISKAGIEYLNRKAGFMINAFHHTIMNDQGYLEIVPPNPSDLR